MRKWIRQHHHEFDNTTSLAEAAAHEASGDNDEWLDDPDHWIWEITIEIPYE